MKLLQNETFLSREETDRALRELLSLSGRLNTLLCTTEAEGSLKAGMMKANESLIRLMVEIIKRVTEKDTFRKVAI